MTAELQSDCLDHNEKWAKAASSEAESPKGKTFSCDILEKQNRQNQDDMEMQSSDSSRNDSSGPDFHGKEATRSLNSTFRRPSKSTGSSNSEQLDRNQSHKELMNMVHEMKRRLPLERQNHNKARTVDALNYALQCVRQVQANSEFFKLLGDYGTTQVDRKAHTIEELEALTSEHPPKNTDTFVVVFSLISGKVVHISEQAVSILNCKKKVLDSSRFMELLAPQDASVFYKHTTQSHLLPWNMGTGTALSYEYTQVKSFFCRIRGGKERDHVLRYYPFQITPYSVNVHNSVLIRAEACCLALVERIPSGYEAPRIPMDKRIFTTTHTPGCVFLEVDDRAVPLLGYLPQDLIGTSVLMYLHPEDRPLMLAMHRKILKYAGQPPFEHSPIRFCTQNGDYIILDTSWSSFVNPWSRKVSFIIGRHKVRTGPLNEDVFAARIKEISNIDKEIKELQGQIYKLLLQPVHNNGSSGYGSLGSNGSYEHYISLTSSSDSNGNCVEEMQREPMTLEQVCADVNRIKDVGQQLYIKSRSRPEESPFQELRREKKTTGFVQPGLKNAGAEGQTIPSCDTSKNGQQHLPSYQQINCVDSIIRYLQSCSLPALKRKCEASTNTISSSSSEDDKQVLQGENDSQILEATTSQSQLSAESMATTESQTTAAVVGAPLTDLTLSIKAMSVVSVTSQCTYSSTIVHVPQPESEVTAIEDAMVGSEQIEVRSFNVLASSLAPEEFLQVGLTKEVLSAHTQLEEQNYVDRFRQRILQSPYRSYLQKSNRSKECSHEQDRSSKQTSPADCRKGRQSGKHKRRKPLESSDSNGSNQNCPPHIRKTGPAQQSWSPSVGSHPSPSNMAFPPPMMIPIQPAFSMPGFPLAPMSAMAGDCMTSSTVPGSAPQSALPYNVQSFPACSAPYMGTVMAVILPNYPVYAQMNQELPQPLFPPQYPCAFSYHLSTPPGPPPNEPAQVAPDFMGPPSPASSPTSAEEPALFSNSRSSSPLQLDLLQEESPEPEGLVEVKCVDAAEDSGNNDSHSASSELLDLLLQEDSQSGTGSAASGSRSAESSSLGSGSNGSSSNGTSGSGIGRSNSSKYFASNDSSETSQEVEETAAFHRAVGDCLWTMIERTPVPVMMTYQVPSRDKEMLLKEDLEKLSAMRNMQPHFTDQQKEELAEVHPWIRHCSIPQEINTPGCVSCESRTGKGETSVINDGGPAAEGQEPQRALGADSGDGKMLDT
ncbi:LOW QUALITY PROTEIN: period circadian protein homolog 3 [Rhinatrema bivittatum]|uniref:LOW QUALITY PROTEIN: period circadian protein homolog 3 n=1 Tax=Rhinatrema bivittatum TaxID=194408 RepID=UPI00112BAC09|nr:LOW QUALITY PROTEIN: period circadian protein homolog 3 [Rhinatrema bivittatum]